MKRPYTFRVYYDVCLKCKRLNNNQCQALYEYTLDWELDMPRTYSFDFLGTDLVKHLFECCPRIKKHLTFRRLDKI